MRDHDPIGRSLDCLCPPPTLSRADVAHLSASTGSPSLGTDVQYGECLMKLYSGDWDYYELLDVMLLAGYAPESPSVQLAVQAAFLLNKRKIQQFVEKGELIMAREWLNMEPPLLRQVAAMLLSQADELESWDRSLSEKPASPSEDPGAS